jgi:hypothetical protein
MRHYDETEAARLNAEPWQIELLHLNPAYTGWGPYEDAMSGGGSWSGAQVFPNWGAFGPWGLDELNECVNFYFSVNRANVECSTCGGGGFHPDAHQTVRTFYRHSCEPGEQPWNVSITDDEATALVKAGRGGPGLLTAEDFNRANAPGARGMHMHDAINRFILIDVRLKRLGIPKACTTCEGHGTVFTEETAHVSLTLWWLHPRKGCSRAIEITHIEGDELPAVRSFLQEARDRNTERFRGVSLITSAEV